MPLSKVPSGLMLRLEDLDAKVNLRQGVDLTSVEVSPQEGFILSRVDGTSTVREICQVSGLGMEATMQIMASLADKGLVTVGGSTRAARTTSKNPVITDAPADGPSSPMDMADEDLVPPGEDYPIKKKMRAYIRSHYGSLDDMNFFQLLCIDPTRELKVIRRAFLQRTKEFHPDRYYGKEIGPYEEMVREVFKHVVRAFRFLEDPAKLESYLVHLRDGGTPPMTPGSPRPAAAATPRAPRPRFRKPSQEELKKRRAQRRWGNEEMVSQAEDKSDDAGGYCFVRKKK